MRSRVHANQPAQEVFAATSPYTVASVEPDKLCSGRFSCVLGKYLPEFDSVITCRAAQNINAKLSPSTMHITNQTDLHQWQLSGHLGTSQDEALAFCVQPGWLSSLRRVPSKDECQVPQSRVCLAARSQFETMQVHRPDCLYRCGIL